MVNIFQASKDGNLPRVIELLDSGTPVDGFDAEGFNALEWASIYGNSEIVTLLLDRGADIAFRNSVGLCALHFASVHGRREVIALLLDRGAAINLQDNDQRTPLHWAAQLNHLPSCLLLIESGADPLIGPVSAYDDYGIFSSEGVVLPSAEEKAKAVATMKEARSNYLLAEQLKEIALLKEQIVVLKHISRSNSAMFLSEELADVVMETGDGERLFAHKCILASSSELMDRMLSGAWSENEDERRSVVKVTQSAAAVKALLKFLYTGGVDEAAIESHTVELVDLAAQHSLGALMEQCEKNLVASLSTSTVVPSFIAAHLHNLDTLNQACVELIQAKAVTVLTSAACRDLERSHKTVWQDLIKRSVPLENEDDAERENCQDNKRTRLA